MTGFETSYRSRKKRVFFALTKKNQKTETMTQVMLVELLGNLRVSACVCVCVFMCISGWMRECVLAEGEKKLSI